MIQMEQIYEILNERHIQLELNRRAFERRRKRKINNILDTILNIVFASEILIYFYFLIFS